MEKLASKRRLERRTALRLGRFSGSLSCVEGLLWLSWKGSEDVFLFPGQEASLRGAEGLVVQALRGAASFRLSGCGSAESLSAAKRGTMLKA